MNGPSQPGAIYIPQVLVEFFHSEHEPELQYDAGKPRVQPAPRQL